MVRHSLKLTIFALCSAIIGSVVITTALFVSRERIIEVNNPITLAEQPSGSSRAVQRAEVRVSTAYTLGNPAETDDTPCIGASNLDLCEIVRAGGVVYASNEFPLHTRISVDGVEGIVLDRMNKRYTNRIDIAMLDRSKALAWGKREVSVRIIK